MDFANRAVAQLTELAQGMTMPARITTVALLVVIGISLTFLVGYNSPSADTFLFGGRSLSDREVDAITSAFSAQGLNAWDTPENRIKVPRGQRHTYQAAIVDANAMPENPDGFLAEIVSTANPFESRQQYDTRLLFARQRDLAHVIQHMKGIETATVRINEERPRGMNRATSYQAFVAVGAVGNQLLTPQQVDSIRSLVAGATRAPLQNVTVTDLQGPTYSGESEADLLGDQWSRTKRFHEAEWRQKIERHLSPMIDGILVEVEVTLDTTGRTTTFERTYTSGEPIRETNSTVRNSTSSGNPPGSVPGAPPNGVLGNLPEEVAPNGSEYTESNETQTFDIREQAVGTRETESDQWGFTPKSVSVSIQVPRSHYRKVWNQQNPSHAGDTPSDPTPEELLAIEQEITTNLQNSIDALLPPTADGSDRPPRIQISSYVDMARPVPPPPSLTSATFAWLAGNWQVLALVAAGIFALLLLRSFAHRRLPQPAVGASTEAIRPSTGESCDVAGEIPDVDRLRSQRTGSHNLQDELAQIVRQDPDAAASVLNQWIGQS